MDMQKESGYPESVLSWIILAEIFLAFEWFGDPHAKYIRFVGFFFSDGNLSIGFIFSLFDWLSESVCHQATAFILFVFETFCDSKKRRLTEGVRNFACAWWWQLALAHAPFLSRWILCHLTFPLVSSCSLFTCINLWLEDNLLRLPSHCPK